ncbi:MAG: hypothetical protein ABIJ57_06245 [Pseudomonadota bacterium]
MRLSFLDSLEQELVRVVTAPGAEIHLLMVHSSIPSDLIPDLQNWAKAKDWVEESGHKAEACDVLLTPVIQAAQQEPDAIWNSILLYLFLRPLGDFLRARKWLDEQAALFSQLHWDFLHAVYRIDLHQRRKFIGQKIINDTFWATRREYAKTFRRPGFQGEDPENSPIDRIPCAYASQAVPEFLIDRDWAIARLKDFARRGRISRGDFQILLGCCLYGRSLDDMATRLGIEYGAAKKRRQRALEKIEKIAPDLSPSTTDSPLYLVERSSRKEAGGDSR